MPRRRSGRGSPDVSSLITRRHEALRSQLADAHSGQVDGVHQARVASRRLREVVPVLGDGLDDIRLKPLRADLRDLTRALGPVRELDVAAGMIDELGLQDADAGRLREAWQGQIDRQRRAPVRALRKALAPRVRERLDRELEAFAVARAESVDQTWRESLARSLTDRAIGLRTRIARTGTLYRPEPLHEVRIAAKKLRYVLEITAEAGLMRLARPLRTLKATQDLLGRLHDLDVLFTLLHDVPGVAPGDDLQHAAAAVVGTLEQQSRRLHAGYLRRRPALTRVTALTLDVVVSRVWPEGQTPRKSPHGR